MRRHKDSKTCPYFHHLDALHKVKNKTDSLVSPRDYVKPSDLVESLMVQPERQWPSQEDNQPETAVGDIDDGDNVE
ncbi:hypothetical protein CJ030_MR3G026230 [Morella rubra]|uniref:Uncharacterized protein n=1 Tax=Morella rubra TaxID=262757 RepID=A0A6A1W6F3_9ROSI|nr:hypothetical protein CJ030_MR3G026230 [Morella rubra]